MKLYTALVVVFVVCCLSLVEGQTYAQEGNYIRGNLTLQLVVRYPESKLTSHSPPLTTDLYVVGNGLGLAWNSPTKLTRTATDTWTIDLKFDGDLDGYRCSSCVHNQLLPVRTRFEYRIMTSNFGDMVGPNFGLLVHTVSNMEPNFPISQHLSYPYFFNSKGTYNKVSVTSKNTFIGTRSWNYYLPASFAENTYKTYPTFFLMDLELEVAMPILAETILEPMFYQDAIAEEAVIIGTVDYSVPPNNDGRAKLLTPSLGINWLCTTGDYFDGCGGCMPLNLPNRDYIMNIKKGCGYGQETGGHAEETLDHMIQEVLPAVQTIGNNRLRTDRDNLGVSGCSLGGIFACHAAWTRPETFGMGACQSSSFWWPTQEDGNCGFEFLNVTLKTKVGPRAPQKIHIDNSEIEDDEYFDMLGSSRKVMELMSANSPQLRKDENLFYRIANGQGHSNGNCFSRTWFYLPTMLPPGGAARNPDPPQVQSENGGTRPQQLGLLLPSLLLLVSYVATCW